MAPPANGVYIVIGEMNMLITAMRKGTRWSTHSYQDEEHDPLLHNFSNLKEVLNHITDLSDLEPTIFLTPFLDVIRSEDTTGPVTGYALSSVNKFLTYDLLDVGCETAAVAAENIADAVTHARFVGTDPASDEVVLLNILQVLRMLLLNPLGMLLTNESVCEIMQSCFRICFEMRLSELLRKSAEHVLMDMVQLLFSRLIGFAEDSHSFSSKKLKMRASGIDTSRHARKRRSPRPKHKKYTTTSPKKDIPFPTPPASTANSPESSLSVASFKTATESANPELQNTSSEKIQGPQGLVESEKVIKSSIEGTNTPLENSTSSRPQDLLISKAKDETVEETYFKVENHASSRDSSTHSHCEEESPCEVIETTITESFSLPHHNTIHVDVHNLASSRFTKDHTLEITEFSERCESSQATNIEQQQDCIYESSLRETSLSSTNDSWKQTTEPLQNSNSADFVPVQTPRDSESLVLESSFPEQRESKNEEYVNPRGVRFTSHQPPKEGLDPLVPYGLPCVRELFRFLVSLICPLDHHNTEMMIQIGLGLLKVALEAGADSIGNFSSLLALVKDDMCRNLFLLLNSERLSLFATTLSVCFLLFEALRTHLKFQLEMYLSRLMEIIVSESAKIFYEQRALALDSVVQLWRIPGLVTELYLNYDCDLYCSNLFEDLTKLLSKNAFPVSGLYSTHLLSLDALLTVIDSIETHCHYRVLTERQSTKDEDVKVTLAAAEPVQMETETYLKHEKPESFGLLASGYHVGQKMQENEKIFSSTKIFPLSNTHNNRIPLIKPNRMSVSENISSHEELMAIKHKKKLLATGTEQFNSKPSKGISFLQENGLLKDLLDPMEVADFLRDNPRLDKWMIGQYISNRKNLKVLEAFIRSFNFEDIRIDEALRMYLETFRLPGEAPLISLLLEHFAEHWHKSNREPFANSDAAFTLAYAIIMLNVDQHNHNVKKQNIPMTSEDFKKNLKNVNGGHDFDEEMLEDVYTAIKSEEIVMPAEQTGLVKENYLWKVLLKRGNGKDGSFIHSPNGLFDHDLFSIIWGPTVAALSFVFDKSTDLAIIQKAISGFRKCAMISAHYGMSDVFDNLVISLCKFTTLMSFSETPETLPVSFGSNNKAQLAARTVFNLAHRHGDILREGWKNLLDCILQLYRAKLLPQVMVEAEDFIHPNRIVSLIREDVPVMPRAESGILSSFYSYITLTADTQAQRAPNPEDQAAKESAKQCIQDCHPEHLVMESKFLRIDSLQELVKALIYACHGPDGHASLGTSYNEDSAVFLLEFLIKIVLQNRDRVGDIWPSVRDHLYSLVMGAGASEHNFLLERAVVGILQLAIRLLRREEMAPQVLQTLRILLLLKPPALMRVARQIAYAIHELLVTTAANIHLSQDWSTLFTLMECVGAGSKPPRILSGLEGMAEVTEGLADIGAQSDSEIGSGRDAPDSGQGSERGYTSDSELYESQGVLSTPKHAHNRLSLESVGGWILVGKEGEIETVQVRPLPVNQYNIILECELQPHDPNAFMKVCESLSFLIRDVAHITPENFESCVHCIRLFVEASLNGGNSSWKQSKGRDCRDKKFTKTGNRKKSEVGRMKKSRSSPSHVAPGYDADDDEQGEDFPSGYQEICIQLLDLMHTLHTRAGSIFQSWAAEQIISSEESSGIKSVTNTGLWTRCWCPLLQGISRLCCDKRRNVRTSALTYLQRALLVHDLQALTPCEWESCFNKVLFPLLSKLLENLSPQDPIGMEETRMRGATLLCKVFLQHLNPLLSLPTFTALWLTILDFMEKYMKTDGSDLLNEAIPESLKNMLLVMDTAGIFQRPEEGYGPANCQLWLITWDRIHAFLPSLKDDVFKPPPSPLLHVSTESVNKEASPDKESFNTISKTALQQQQKKTVEDIKVPLPPQRCPMVQDLVSEANTKDKLSGPSTLTSAPDLPSSVILHPPAFTISPPPPISTHVHTTTTTVPLLLNPSVMGHISPQTLPGHPPCETKEESFLGS